MTTITHTHTHLYPHSYKLISLCASAEGCMRALLGHELPQLDGSAMDRPPQAPAVASMEKTIAFLSKSQLLHTYYVHVSRTCL